MEEGAWLGCVHEDEHEVIHEGGMWYSGVMGMISMGADGEPGRVMGWGQWW